MGYGSAGYENVDELRDGTDIGSEAGSIYVTVRGLKKHE